MILLSFTLPALALFTAQLLFEAYMIRHRDALAGYRESFQRVDYIFKLPKDIEI